MLFEAKKMDSFRPLLSESYAGYFSRVFRNTQSGPSLDLGHRLSLMRLVLEMRSAPYGCLLFQASATMRTRFDTSPSYPRSWPSLLSPLE